jgi:hypothetical protein
MNATAKPERSADKAAVAISAVEGEIRGAARRDLNVPRRGSEPAEINADHFSSLVERVAGASVKEIENLIAELQGVRNFLMAEGERMQRELANYAHSTQAALSSAKIITESMGQWKNSVGGSSRSARG